MRDITYEQSQKALEAQKDLAQEGLVLPVKPKGDIPRVPERITDLDDSSMMGIFAMLTRWTDYLSVQLALAQIEERFAESSVDSLLARYSILHWPDSGEKVTVMKALRDEEPELKDARDLQQMAYARRKLVETLYNNAERDAALISRELTRRIGRHGDNERRVDRWKP